MMRSTLAALLALCAVTVTASPLCDEGDEVCIRNEASVQAFLMTAGYIPKVESRDAPPSSQEINSALRKMQAFYGLPETGKVDTSTLDLVRAPRCGFPDVKAFSTFVNEPRWDRYDLTYRIVNSSIYTNYEMVEAAIAKAFKTWADATAFKFSKVEDDQADIIIYFVKGAHEDNAPFFPTSNTMAHAYPPGKDIGGDIHFNDAFVWANGNIPVVLTFPEESVCHFPFIYKDQPHYECIKDDRYPWCGLTENVDKDWKRGWCPEKGLLTYGGNGLGFPCVFPFLYGGTWHKNCLQDQYDGGYSWCSTTSNYDVDQKHGICPEPFEAGTTSGNANGAPCVFPFVAYGKEFNRCTSEKRQDGRLWCATTKSYDKDAKYGLCQKSAMDLAVVAAHEIGHSLGLGHSRNMAALMYPTYTFDKKEPVLMQDDLDGIKSLYGIDGLGNAQPRIEMTTKEPTQAMTTTPSAGCSHISKSSWDESQGLPNVAPVACETTKFDAITDIDGKLYFFKDGYFWYNDHSELMKKPHGPRFSADRWPKFPAKLSAAFQNKYNGKTYFISGSLVWQYAGRVLEACSPLPLSTLGLPSSVDHIRGVLAQQNVAYIFGDSQLWRMKLQRGTVTTVSEKKETQLWPGVAPAWDTVFHTRNHNYFVTGDVFQKVSSRGRILLIHYLRRSFLGCSMTPETPEP
uniref:72 kDa type IV collagenase-like isoform X2 n=1 Tax=Myxine glutinosa TaxID=7769 RepID=UPI00358F177E